MTGLSDLAAWGLTALLLCAALLMLRRPLAWLIRLALRSSLGLAVLAVLSQTGGALGLSLGVNLEYVHRIGVIAAGTLDTLPHQGGQITILAITHMNHKTAYLDICVTQLIIPLITVFAVTIPLCMMGL